jgi:hypothetical protein
MTVSDLLEQPCNKPDNINKVVTCKLLTACSKLVDNLGQAVRTQFVDRLATRCEIFTCVSLQTSRQVVVLTSLIQS